MPFLFVYLLKLSVSLAVVFLFYYFILRKLTFYNHNRWYLLGYTVLSFLIPFINLSPVLENNNWQQNQVITWIPVIGSESRTAGSAPDHSGPDLWTILLLVLAVGMMIMLVRLVIQLLSLRRLLKKAVPVSSEGISLYQLDKDISPFSFGNSIYLNTSRHTEEELAAIIRHEIVHVKQKHGLDILWGEILCLLNWYNPFAWFIRHAIRQNLEFIADHQVLEKGADRKQYQYLLLKVTASMQYSITASFRFSSLKKRIAMMNKLKSTRKQLLRLLFLLPATAVLLLAFRSRWTGTEQHPNSNTVSVAGLVVNSVTMEPLNNATIYIKEKNITVNTDANGYYLVDIPFENKPLSFTMLVSKKGYTSFYQTENWGNFTEADVYARYSKTIEFFGLSPSGEENNSFSSLAGNGATKEALSYKNVLKRLEELRNEEMNEDWDDEETDTIPALKAEKGDKIMKEFLKRNPDVLRVGWVYAATDDALRLVIHRNDGTTEEYNLNNEADLRKAESKYGKLPVAPPPPPPPPPPPAELREVPIPPDASGAPKAAAGEPIAPGDFELTEVRVVKGAPKPPSPPEPVKLPENVKSINVSNNKATVILKNGNKENYDLSKPAEKEAFEKKYGKVLPAPPQAPAATGSYSPTVSAVGHGSSTSGKPVYIVNGVLATVAEINAIEPARIARVDVLKGDKATAAYGSKAKDGAVLITTSTNEPVVVTGYRSSDDAMTEPMTEIAVKNRNELIILDGKELADRSTNLRGTFRIVTLTKEEAVKKYGEKGKNGAMEITTIK